MVLPFSPSPHVTIQHINSILDRKKYFAIQIEKNQVGQGSGITPTAVSSSGAKLLSDTFQKAYRPPNKRMSGIRVSKTSRGDLKLKKHREEVTKASKLVAVSLLGEKQEGLETETGTDLLSEPVTLQSDMAKPDCASLPTWDC